MHSYFQEHSVQHNCEVAFLTLCPGATADTQFEARTQEEVQTMNFLYFLRYVFKFSPKLNFSTSVIISNIKD